MATRWGWAGQSWQAVDFLSPFDLIDFPLIRRAAGAQILRIAVTTRDLLVAEDGNASNDGRVGRDPAASLLKRKRDGAEGRAEVLVWLVGKAPGCDAGSV